MVDHRVVEYNLIACNRCGNVFNEHTQATLNEQVQAIRKDGWYIKYENAVKYDADKVICPHCIKRVCEEWCDAHG